MTNDEKNPKAAARRLAGRARLPSAFKPGEAFGMRWLQHRLSKPVAGLCSKVAQKMSFGIRASDFIRHSSFVIRHFIRISDYRVVAPSAAMALLLAAPSARAQNPNSIIYSPHNLSVSSPGSVHASTEADICIFCHTPHFASGEGPLWNHQMSAAVYRPYSSSTMKATTGQPTGASRLCLSCHDGTVALGMVNSRPGGIAMNVSTMPAEGNLGTDLSGDHPISFVYDRTLTTRDGSLRDPHTLPQAVQMDRSGELQCTGCHDPHNNQYGNFLVMDNTGSALCLSCHSIANWPASSHATSGRPLPEVMVNLLAANESSTAKAKTAKILTVSGAACASCHVPHGAGGKEELTRFAAPEKNCAFCHTSSGPGQNVMSEFNKVSVHPILVNSASHTPDENPINPAQRHVTCVDCHNPHVSDEVAGSKARISGALAGVTGVTAGGTVTHNVVHEYELCFRCHGDSAMRGPARVPRQYVETNTRRQFNPGNTSFHPVEAIGKNAVSPSLIQPLTPSTFVSCTDCHNNDQGPGAGGNGSRGPHGSAFVPLLERRLLLTDGIAYNPDNFALCYKCHSPTVVDSQLNTSWAFHQQHIETYKAACTTCHDSHGANLPHLINFNTAYVMPFNGVVRYTSTGMNHGVCTLTCHDGNGRNQPHNATAY
jgi:predicted CXXCH cytochrome family protein